MEKAKQLTEQEIDLIFARFTDNITMGDPKDMAPIKSDNFKWPKEDRRRIKIYLRQYPQGSVAG